ncbi:MAG: hypothetical protein WCO13_06205 [Bacteroidota bacterium]
MNKLYITVKAEKAIEIGAILQQLTEEKNFNLYDYDYTYADDFVTIILSNQSEIVDYIINEGFSEFVRIGTLNEDLIKAGDTDNKVTNVLIKYLDKIGLDSELIIIDSYFYAPRPKNPNYITVLTDTLKKFLPSITDIIVVTLPDIPKRQLIDPRIKADIETSLKGINATLNITSLTSDNYHDRFWISNNREKGIIVGSSLNSLGNKYALVDRLNITDVREIISSLKTEGLIT